MQYVLKVSFYCFWENKVEFSAKLYQVGYFSLNCIYDNIFQIKQKL